MLGVENGRAPQLLSQSISFSRQWSSVDAVKVARCTVLVFASSLPNPFLLFARREPLTPSSSPYGIETVCCHVANRLVRVGAARAGHMV